MHSTLARQIKKYLPGIDPANEQWREFFDSIDESYRHFDDDRKLISRSLDLSSKELVEVNERIAKEKARDDVILESVGEGLIVTDAQGKILLINRSGESLLNCKASEMKGQTFADCILSIADEKGVILPQESQPINSALATGFKTSMTCLLMRKDNKQIIASILATPYILNTNIAGVACIIRDVTQERAVDHAKSEFVSLASHQLRTPLSTIGWYTEMMLAGDAGPINEEQKSYLEEIYHGNKRMVDLVNALLNVSRIELGTFMLTPEPVNFVDICKSVLKELFKQIHEKELVIEENYQNDLPLIPADSKLTRIIFQNILTNAVKYTPSEGRIKVGLRIKTGEEMKHGKAEEKYVLFYVSDSGYGIPKHQQDKIFTKLFRADNVREKETDGTGLGLYLVRAVLEASGGEVWFESEENKGTTFNIIVPLSGMKAKEGQKNLV